MDLFALPGVVERVMSNLCSGKVIVQGQGTSLSEAKRTVIRLAFVPGVLRYLSHREGYELALRDLPLGAVVDMQSVDVDIEKLVNIARAKSRSPVAGAERLLIDLHECLSTPLYDEIRYCSGHDVCAIWALLFREEYGITIGSAQLERILRSAIGCYEFQQLTVVRQLGEWGQRVGVKLWDCAA